MDTTSQFVVSLPLSAVEEPTTPFAPPVDRNVINKMTQR
jgi:hypothetical protein